MPSMKEHLASFHGKEAAHHAKKVAFHASAADHFKKVAAHIGKTEVSEATKDSKGILEALASMHEEQSQEHAGMAEFHTDCGEKCMKAADGDLDKLAPTSVSAVAPTRPTAVLRPGMQPIATNGADDFSKIFGLNPEDEHTEETSLR